MTLTEYQEKALRTYKDLQDDEKNMAHMNAGIIGELGEMVDICKRDFAYGKQMDLVHLGEEIGDVAWFCVCKLNMLGEDLIDMAVTGKKLSALEVFYVIEDYIKEEENENLLLYTLKFISVSVGLDFYDLLDKNIRKLAVRYPDKFTDWNALNRDLDAERGELEK